VKLHDEDGRQLRRVYVTVPAPEAEALLGMIANAAEGVRDARGSSDPATEFMFVLDGDVPEPPPESSPGERFH
jgi:hypothetical protein